MSEQTVPYLLNTCDKPDTMDAQTHSDFVEVRTRKGRLVFRFDPTRMLVEWKSGTDAELIDLMPYLAG